MTMIAPRRRAAAMRFMNPAITMPADAEGREQVSVSGAAGAQLVAADHDEEHRVSAIHEACQDAEAGEQCHLGGRNERADPCRHLLEWPGGSTLGDVRRTASHAHPAHQQRGETERGGVDGEHHSRRAKEQQHARDRRADDDGEVLHGGLRAVGGGEMFLADDCGVVARAAGSYDDAVTAVRAASTIARTTGPFSTATTARAVWRQSADSRGSP